MDGVSVNALMRFLQGKYVARKQRVSVGCISPFKAQVNAIQEKLGNKYKYSEDLFSVIVRSVDGFEGSEEDMMFVNFGKRIDFEYDVSLQRKIYLSRVLLVVFRGFGNTKISQHDAARAPSAVIHMAEHSTDSIQYLSKTQMH
ncbi:hypothetical protein Ccrd_012942 [Cynara cardunculus var. scolymus]|uniref:DNA2/NAM7 helicase-like C-terminal domain-containing protein n=1 Tax=Cynara cardunculus var. scolymus TaxID=59895 RepID=A0A103YGK4_CYNCS|nr:hypothetical protein Ccrd_012942 [Cynara cardunculus var. scolymus]